MNSIPRRLERVDFAQRRTRMVDRQIAHRGVRSKLVLTAMKAVPRESFLPEELWDLAYEDAPLPIAEGQTISQPYIVAMMTEALGLHGGETVLEVGTGSGYAAAVLSQIAADVYTIERIGELAEKSAARLAELGFSNVHVLHGDGTLGWPEHAPYDAIVVAAGGPDVPQSLKAQLKIGGRLIIPVGSDRRLQELVRVTRVSEDEYTTEDLADVRFVPLIGAEGWVAKPDRGFQMLDGTLARSISGASEKFATIESVDLEPMLQRIGAARVVLLGEATHGTSEFYRMRARISRELIQRKGFSFVAIEGDWPMRLVSIITSGIGNMLRRSGWHSRAFQHGCGGIARCESSSTGCESITPMSNLARGWRFMVSISTACTIRFVRSWNTWTPSTRKPLRSHGCATDA